MPRIKSVLSFTGRAIGYIFLLLFSIILIVGGLSTLFGPPLTPGNVPVANVTGTLALMPEIHDDYRGKYQAIKITLTEYPGRSFNIVDGAYDALECLPNADYVISGDSVWMDVSAEDYTNNILPHQESENILPVAVYGLRSKKRVFLTVDGYCKEANSDPWVGYILIGFGGLLLVAIFIELRQRKRMHASLS